MAWVISEFSSDRAIGRARDTDTGREIGFAIESWWPCDPVTARALDDSDERRHLLLPQVGEFVAITWKRSYRGDEVPARVARLRPIDRMLPPRTFLDWLAAMGVHVDALAGWRDGEWQELALDHEIDETVRSASPLDPVQHLALLAWIAANDTSRIVAHRLAWIVGVDAPGAAALEGAADHPIVHVALAPRILAALVGDRLVLPL